MPKRESWLKRTDNGLRALAGVLYAGPNARTDFDKDRLDELREQIRQEGVLEPLLVRRRKGTEPGQELEVWDGGRRLKCIHDLAAQGHRVEYVPVVISRANESELMIRAAMTQTGKAKLDAVDEARLIKMLLGYGLDVATIVERLGASESWVRNRQALIGLEPRGRRALRAGEITLGRALQLARQDAAAQVTALKSAADRKAQGEKKPGSVVRRPGKKAFRALSLELESPVTSRTAPTWADLRAVISWAAGDLPLDQLQTALGLETTTTPPAPEAPEPRPPLDLPRSEGKLAAMHRAAKAENLKKTQDALGVTPPARPGVPS